MTRALEKLALVVLLGAALGCEQSGTKPIVALDPRAALPVEGALVYPLTEEGDNSLLVADLSDDSPAARTFALPSGKLSLQVRQGSEPAEVVALTAGTSASRDGTRLVPQEEAHVVRVDRAGEVARYGLGGRFDALALSDDGRYGVAYAPTSGLANDVAIVDFEAAPADAVRALGLRLLDGQAPASFRFGTVAGRSLLVALTPSAVSVLDLARLDAVEPDVVVPLAQAELGGGAPAEVLFGESALFVRAAGGRDVWALSLNDSDAPRGFEVSPLRLATTFAVSDVALYGQGDGARIVAVGAQRVSVLDPNTGSGEELALGIDAASVVLFDAAAPNDDSVRTRALVVGRGASIAFLDLSSGQGGLNAEAIELVSVPNGVASVTSVEELGLLLLVHDDQRFSVLELASRTISLLNVQGSILDYELDVRGGHPRLWYALASGTVGVLDLASRRTNELLFTLPIASLVSLPGEGALLAAQAAASDGSVAVLDGQGNAPTALWELHGFSWAGVLDGRGSR
jgi:hypothetical protein